MLSHADWSKRMTGEDDSIPTNDIGVGWTFHNHDKKIVVLS